MPRKFSVEPIDWGGMVKRFREAGLTSIDVAEYCGCDPSSVRHLMNPERKEPGYTLGSSMIRLWRKTFRMELIPQTRDAYRPD